jgi:hypothetical protein
LVSIYGSNPQGEPVEELEEVFYEEVGAAFAWMLLPAPARIGVFLSLKSESFAGVRSNKLHSAKYSRRRW